MLLRTMLEHDDFPLIAAAALVKVQDERSAKVAGAAAGAAATMAAPATIAPRADVN